MIGHSAVTAVSAVNRIFMPFFAMMSLVSVQRTVVSFVPTSQFLFRKTLTTTTKTTTTSTTTITTGSSSITLLQPHSSLSQQQLFQQQRRQQRRRQLQRTFLASTASSSTTEERTTKPKAVATTPQKDDDEEVVEMLPTNENDEELLKIRHSSAHVMAMAVQQLYPDAQVTIGPWIDNGFYYDFYFPEGGIDEETGETIPSRKLTDSDLKQIKKGMDKIISQNYPITREEVSREEAKRRIEAIGEPFKLEILDSIETEPITIYHIGTEWWDLCAGPHVDSTGQLPKKAIALQNVAGAYWRGDETREMLQRVYATAWKHPQQLKQYKQLLQEAKKRDHRMLGTKLNLFSIQEDAGGGLVFWHPRGSKVRQCIEDFWKQEHEKQGYDIVYSPHIANLNLWKTSGHYDFYRQDMFDQMDVENDQYQIKPMNCPFHCLMYKDQLRSYRDLPFRWAELGTVYRYERSGTLHGLMRVRGFTQDDAHIFCLPDQLQDEIVSVLDLIETILSRFGFNQYDIQLSTRPEKSVGSSDIWEAATLALKGALEAKQWEYTIDEGGGAFYGPKIDIKIRDAIGRQWQCSTVQCDFNLPERFDLTYVNEDGNRKDCRPIMVHRAIFGSIERFFGILIENCSGDFPLWLSPTQLKVLPVTDAVQSYCTAIAKQASEQHGIRVEVDRGNERLAKQIRTAEQQRVPLMAIIGRKEMDQEQITIRSRALGDLGTFPVSTFFKDLQSCIDSAIEFTMMGSTEKEATEEETNNNENETE